MQLGGPRQSLGLTLFRRGAMVRGSLGKRNSREAKRRDNCEGEHLHGGEWIASHTAALHLDRSCHIADTVDAATDLMPLIASPASLPDATAPPAPDGPGSGLLRQQARIAADRRGVHAHDLLQRE